jgi:hypothetical protein
MTNAPMTTTLPPEAEHELSKLTSAQKDALLVKCYETLTLAKQCHEYQKKIIASTNKRTAILMLLAFAIGAYIGGAL